MVRILAAFLVAANGLSNMSFTAADHMSFHDDGLSLLQKRATVLLSDLPDPRKVNSKLTGKVEIETADPTGMECNGGKGKWVFMNTQTDPGRTYDITTHTKDIKSFTCQPSASAKTGERCEHHSIDFNAPGTPAYKQSWTEHAPPTSAEECYARARIDQLCNHQTDNIANYDSVSKGLGVWWAPANGFPALSAYASWAGPAKARDPSKPAICACGPVKDNSEPNANGGMPTAGKSFRVNVNNMDSPGAWFCQFLPGDTEDVDENTPRDTTSAKKSREPREPGEKKEKKSDDDKEECAAAKVAAKDSKAELKALRRELKAARADARASINALKDQIAEAKAAWREKKGVVQGAC